MNLFKRCMSLALALTMASTLILPIHAVDPLASTFASATVSAATQDKVDTTQQNLKVQILRRNSSALFVPDDSVSFTCGVNRAAGYSEFRVTPNTDNVWVEVDYLTDLDGKNGYEMLDGEAKPVNDLMSINGNLSSHFGITNPAASATYSLKKGTTYKISSTTLLARAKVVMNARRTANSGQTVSGISTDQELPPLFFISIHYYSEIDKQEYTLGYYLTVFDSVIVPSDVPPTQWYYSYVEYVLDKGLLAGTGGDSFSPDGIVTRSQIAQILWRLGGSQSAKPASFSDVKSDEWYYDAVSWCAQEGLMGGTGNNRFEPESTLTREQLCLVLQQYAKYAKQNTSAAANISGYKDASSVSSWAMSAVKWAVAEKVLSGYEDNTLRPNKGISRAEVSAVLRSFTQKYALIK